MRYWGIVLPGLPAQAMALYPFMLFKNEELKRNKKIIFHEQIHFRQQVELLLILFYLLYAVNYLFNYLRFKNHHKAYANICFEREAYRNEDNIEYLATRRPFAWSKLM